MDGLDSRNTRQRNGAGRWIFQSRGFAKFSVCAVLVLAAASAPAMLAEMRAVGPIRATGMGASDFASKLADAPVFAARQTSRYHSSVGDRELESAVSHAAQQYHLQPALLLAVMKAESSFNPIVVSKAGAVGLMQLIPETAIRHGVRNLYDAKENIAGGAKHLRYLLDRFHGNLRLALAAYNAGERKVDRYGKIPPYKETQEYVKKVLVYYRGYKRDGWVTPAAMAVPSVYGSRPY